MDDRIVGFRIYYHKCKLKNFLNNSFRAPLNIGPQSCNRSGDLGARLLEDP
jgi:hypothetical protein